MTKGKAFVWLLFFSIDAPVGVFIGIGLSQVSEVVKTVALAISAGTLVYVGAFEVLSLEVRAVNSSGNAEYHHMATSAVCAECCGAITLLQFGGHHHETVASVSPEGDSVPQDSPGPEEISLKATMRTKSSGSSARWLRNQLYLAYVLGVLTIALVAFVPHGHGDHDHTHH